MHRFLFIIAVVIATYSSPVSSVEVKSDYKGPNVAHADSFEEGTDMCKKAHVLNFYQNVRQMPPPGMLAIMIKESIDNGYCYGFFGSGDIEGNHFFSCYGITWRGGTKINLYEESKEEWERSKKEYGAWVNEKHSNKFI